MTTRSLLHYDPSGEFTLPALQGWSIIAVDDALAAQKLANQQCYVVGICSINAASALPPIEELVADTPLEWIAVLPPAYIANCDTNRLISQSFYDYHTLPIDPRRLEITLGRAWGIGQLKIASRTADGAPPTQYEMVGASPQMHALFHTIRKVATVDAPVLV
ncbi:MAG: VpsR-related response regulator [Burkholderiales bacterium]|nr:VpsR-related response regulator [Pseudomonadota bacterium]